ncbi:putative triacylglycerol lipase [Blattamonas nauphoetae]|uniref:Triacylglycerol lipase n=1 Tax=Blattamonas nauphoetae TaxID=2049346 RepID=A0ABQ9Y0F9_9EUKA|nr:putative triacylglycerol lipase [Blattamonas nauphoetae]
MSLQTSKTYPIVLVHGVTRFDAFTAHLFKSDKHPLFDGSSYWMKIRPLLRSSGFIVEIAHLSFAASANTQAKLLYDFVRNVLVKHQTPKVHFICHSFGGVVVRHMLWNYQDKNIADNVASVTTLATPHLGATSALNAIETVSGTSYRKFLSKLSPPVTLRELGFPTADFLAEYYFSHVNAEEASIPALPTPNPVSTSALLKTSISHNVAELQTPPLPSEDPSNPLPDVSMEDRDIFLSIVSFQPLPPVNPNARLNTPIIDDRHAHTPQQNALPTPTPPQPSSFIRHLPLPPSPMAFLSTLQPAVFDPTSPTFGIRYPNTYPPKPAKFFMIDYTGAIDMLPVHALAFDMQVRQFEKALPIKFMTFAGDMGMDWPMPESAQEDVEEEEEEEGVFPPPISAPPIIKLPPIPPSPRFESPPIPPALSADVPFSIVAHTPYPSPTPLLSSTTERTRAPRPRGRYAKSHLAILPTDGPNDGRVGVLSARWREEYFCPPVLPIDHQSFTGAEFPWEKHSKQRRVSERAGVVKEFWLEHANYLAGLFPLNQEEGNEDGKVWEEVREEEEQRENEEMTGLKLSTLSDPQEDHQSVAVIDEGKICSDPAADPVSQRHSKTPSEVDDSISSV